MEREPLLESLDFELPAGRMLRLQRARGWTLQCATGALLVTQEGDLRDLVLCAGGKVGIASHGRVLVEASGAANAQARVRLTRPARQGLSLGQPVARLVKPSVAQARPSFARPGPCAEFAGPLTLQRVFGEPRLLEQLVRQARRERNALLGACAAGALRHAVKLAAWTVRGGVALSAVLGRLATALRPRLPSLQESFAALVFLRSRS